MIPSRKPSAELAAIATSRDASKDVRTKAIRILVIRSAVVDAFGAELPAMPQAAKRIIRETAEAHYLEPEALMLKARQGEIARARHEAMYRLRHELRKPSYPLIGKWLGGLDHTTVLHGVRRHAERLAEEGAR